MKFARIYSNGVLISPKSLGYVINNDNLIIYGNNNEAHLMHNAFAGFSDSDKISFLIEGNVDESFDLKVMLDLNGNNFSEYGNYDYNKSIFSFKIIT